MKLMTIDDFKHLDITRLGDILTLKEYVQSFSSTGSMSSQVFRPSRTRKRRADLLKEAMRESGIDVDPDSCQSEQRDGQQKFRCGPGRPKSQIRKATVGLRKLDTCSKERATFTQVKAPLGDGTVLNVNLNIKSSYQEIHDLFVHIMFPDGRNKQIGKLSDYKTDIVNAANESIEPYCTNLENYLDKKKVSTIRFHLLCKPQENDAYLSDESEIEPMVSTPRVRRRLVLRHPSLSPIRATEDSDDDKERSMDYSSLHNDPNNGTSSQRVTSTVPTMQLATALYSTGETAPVSTSTTNETSQPATATHSTGQTAYALATVTNAASALVRASNPTGRIAYASATATCATTDSSQMPTIINGSRQLATDTRENRQPGSASDTSRPTAPTDTSRPVSAPETSQPVGATSGAPKSKNR